MTHFYVTKMYMAGGEYKVLSKNVTRDVNQLEKTLN